MDVAEVSAEPGSTTEAPETAPETPTEAPAGLGGAETISTEPKAFGDWRDNLPEEIRQNPALADKDTPEKLASEHVHLQKLIGAKGIIKPGADASEDEMNAFYSELGRPDTVDGYDLSGIEVPDGFAMDEGMQRQILTALHSRGATPELVTEVFNTYWAATAEAEEAATAKTAEVWEKTQETLKGELGDKYAAHEELANRAVSAVLGDAKADVLNARLPDGTKLSANIGFVRTMFELGKHMAEANLLGDKSASLGLSPEAAKAELQKFEADNSAALLDRSHADHKTVVERRSQLSKIAHPDNTPPVQAF